jgi:23S rRNA (adenine2503-C2)-methyltransferase
MHTTAPAIEKTADTRDDSAELLAAKPSLVGLTREQLAQRITALGIEPFRAKQIWQWMYTKGATEFAQMSNIKKETQSLLAEQFTIARAGVSRNAVSFDQTQKWLLKFADGNEVETVFIPDSNRGTLCVSSQVGCTLSCTFCHTGTQRLVRNLTPSEIITQLLVARDGLGEWEGRAAGSAVPPPTGGRLGGGRNMAISEQITPPPQPSPYGGGGAPVAPLTAHTRTHKQTHGTLTREKPARQISNIVFMGMGEPLFNYDNVVTACNLMMDGDGLALSRRKITVSTSGVVPRIRDLAKDAGCNLAISLHAVTDELRDVIVPINRKYPIAELLDACRDYQALVSDRHIMFEYVMLNGVNDSIEDAQKLVQLLKGIRAKVNLIPFNPWPGAPYTCSSNNRIHAFGRVLIAAGIAAPIRKTRGDDIMAACGQLKSMSELKKGQKVKL